MRWLPVLSLLAACGSSTTTPMTPDATPADPNGCTMHLQPTASQSDVQTAFVGATSGSVICFDAGTYTFTDELSVTGTGITIKGVGDVTWDFSKQVTGENGLHGMNLTDFVLEDVRIVDAPMNGVRVDVGTHVTFRRLNITWTGGPKMTNGAYAIYPVTCDGVLIEDSDFSNSSDAAIYVGQSKNILVRRNRAHSAAAGIEIENSSNAEVTNNEAFDATGGILVFALPGLPVKLCEHVLVHDNYIEANNLPSIAPAGNIVALVPAGSGMVVMAAHDVEIRNNAIQSNISTGVVVNSCDALNAFGGPSCDDPGFSHFPAKVNIHDNQFVGNGTAPTGFFVLFEENGTLADVVWDGVMANSTDMQSDYVCFKDNGAATYRNGDASDYPGANWKMSDDPTPVTCTQPALPSVDVSWTRP